MFWVNRCRCVAISIFLAQHFEMLCSLFTCLESLDCLDLSCFVLLNTKSLCSFLTCLRPSNLCFFVLLNTDSLSLLLSCLWHLSKYPYFRHTCSWKLFSPLPTKAPSAHVAFTRAFEYFDLFLNTFNSVSVLLLSILLLLLSSVFPSTQPSHAIPKRACTDI